MRTLPELVQALPPQLYDEILELTLTTDAKEVKIDKDYKPPIQLQLSRATRKWAEKKYYANTIFTYQNVDGVATEDTLLVTWLKSVPLTARPALKTIHFFDIFRVEGFGGGWLDAAEEDIFYLGDLLCEVCGWEDGSFEETLHIQVEDGRTRNVSWMSRSEVEAKMRTFTQAHQ